MEELTKEELIQTPKKKHRQIFIIYSVLCILSMVNCAVYVSPKSVYLCLTLCTYWVLFLLGKALRMPLTVIFVIGIILYSFIAFYLKILVYTGVTYRHPWQYEKEMADYRQYQQYVSYFPETIPDCATDVSLQIFPGMWRAKSYINLSFTADEAYLQECKEKHMEWFYEYQNMDPHDLPDDALSDCIEAACVDLYPLYEKELSQHYTAEAMRVLSISEEEAHNRIIQWLLPHNISLTKEELRSARQYHICESQGQGFIIIEDTNRIIFYKDNEH